jgi:large subunit ribosomal protein L6
VAGKTLKLSLGFSHPIEFPIPEGVQIQVEDRNTRIKINGFDRQQVGQVAADIRALRPPDVYKLKGIRYSGEQLRKKAGKTGAK